jgi:hypothetical protein
MYLFSFLCSTCASWCTAMEQLIPLAPGGFESLHDDSTNVSGHCALWVHLNLSNAQYSQWKFLTCMPCKQKSSLILNTGIDSFNFILYFCLFWDRVLLCDPG